LSATGLRSIRYAKEIPSVKKIIANDLASDAVSLIHENIKSNEVDTIVQPNQGDANSALFILKSQGASFSVIDLDPYGSAAPFLDSAVQNINNGGLLCITCTDMAVLCASYPETCYAKYSSVPIKGDVAHEAVIHARLALLSHYFRPFALCCRRSNPVRPNTKSMLSLYSA
jgi:tRNA (guanine26-N2/guanine27-N2)-dimethyltransferase